MKTDVDLLKSQAGAVESATKIARQSVEMMGRLKLDIDELRREVGQVNSTNNEDIGARSARVDQLRLDVNELRKDLGQAEVANRQAVGKMVGRLRLEIDELKEGTGQLVWTGEQNVTQLTSMFTALEVLRVDLDELRLSSKVDALCQ